MKRIADLERKIRDYVNRVDLSKKYSENPDEWNTLCVAMDTMGDSCLALEYYESSGVGKDDGEKYLKLYGMLQAIFLQQDSIRQIHRILVGNDLHLDSGSAWMKTRDLRNLTVGHPIEKKNKGGKVSRCFISRVSISSRGFDLIIWDKDERETRHDNVDFASLYNEYKLEATGILNNICHKQDK
ncbi:MAG: hypothetical protein HY883_00330 [Deltaproteobacteria bacterium]|nr:hypothetical protein [Deltaproteobacteria bacterium]